MIEYLMSLPRDAWVAISFIPIPMAVALALWRADRGSLSTFKLVHFVTSDTGRGSVYALGYTVLVLVCAWGIWALIVLDRLTEWYLTAVIFAFVLGTLGSTGMRMVQRLRGAPDPDPAAGDLDDPPIPFIPPQPAQAATDIDRATVGPAPKKGR